MSKISEVLSKNTKITVTVQSETFMQQLKQVVLEAVGVYEQHNGDLLHDVDVSGRNKLRQDIEDRISVLFEGEGKE